MPLTVASMKLFKALLIILSAVTSPLSSKSTLQWIRNKCFRGHKRLCEGISVSVPDYLIPDPDTAF
jgi:hypothetical protein